MRVFEPFFCFGVQILPAIFKAAWNPDEKEREKGIEEAQEGLQFLENELKGKFFNGDSVGFVDIAGLSLAFWLPIFEEAGGFVVLSGEKFPKLYEWAQEILNDPTVKEALPPRDPLLAFFKTRVPT